MPFIRFLVNHTVKAADGATYAEGDVLECSDSGAEHFTRRQLAVLCDPPKPPVEAEEEPKRKPRKKAVTDEKQD